MSRQIHPLHDKVIASDMHFGEITRESGVILLNDDMKSHGIHPRWCKVYAVGPKNHSGIEPGMWILVEHARWTHGIDMSVIDPENYKSGDLVIRHIDTEAILGYTWEDPKAHTELMPSEYSDA